jgi:hypothetical protein
VEKSPAAAPVSDTESGLAGTFHTVPDDHANAAQSSPDVFAMPHFAHTGPVPRQRRRSLGGLVVGYGVFGLIAVLFVFVRMVVRTLGLPAVTNGIVFAIFGLATLGLFGWVFVRWFRANRALPPNFTKSDERFRVRCIGTPERLDQLFRIGPIQDNPFEPEEFTGLLVLPPRAEMIVLWIVVSLVAAAAAFLLPIGLPPGATVFVLYGAFAAGGIAVALIWPTRIRVVPGRVDIVRCLVFTPDRPERHTFTLRTSPLVVDLRKWQAFITGPSLETSIYLWLWPIRGRLELAHALLMGAVSTASPGPLPDDPVTHAQATPQTSRMAR